MKRRDFLYKFLIIQSIFNINTKITYAIDNNKIPKIGSKAPHFELLGSSLLDQKKSSWKLEDFKDSWLILYFYPKDFTGGCTIEAKGFKNIENKLHKLKANIVGISADAIEDHDKFCSSENLSYPLLSDTNGKVSFSYGSWNDPYSARNTFIIDPEGIIKYRWIGIKPYMHAENVINVLTKLVNESNA